VSVGTLAAESVAQDCRGEVRVHHDAAMGARRTGDGELSPLADRVL